MFFAHEALPQLDRAEEVSALKEHERLNEALDLKIMTFDTCQGGQRTGPATGGPHRAQALLVWTAPDGIECARL
jgi:hypothetical protein